MVTIGQILIQEGIITMPQLKQALDYQKSHGGRLGEALVSLGFISPFELKQFFNVVPAVPMRAEQTGLTNSFLTDMILKLAHTEGGTFTMPNMSQSLCLTTNVIDELTQTAKKDGLIIIRAATGFNLSQQMFELTTIGRQRAVDALEQCRYVGPVPVPLKHFNIMTQRQTVRQIDIDFEWVQKALGHLVLKDQFIRQLGPAFNSGSSIFLYGAPGLGKSSIAEGLSMAIESCVYIPYAVEIDGQVMRVFDTSVHIPVESGPAEENQISEIMVKTTHDLRWKYCRRPVVTVGGELTLAALDLDYDPISRIYEAPAHIKATNGVFVLDDLGRQVIQPRQLLNRWIVPMERGVDYLSLHTGRKFSVPFDQITFFCTNMKPSDLVDDAFLRRIRHKIKVDYQSESEFLETIRRVCEHYGVCFSTSAADYLIENYYTKAGRPMVGSHPRDLVQQIIDRARFMKIKPELSPEAIDAAAGNYFVKHE